MYATFVDDLAIGEQVELLVVERLKEHYGERFVFNGFSGVKVYDITFTMDGVVYTMEIKSDFYTADTGNVVIEYESRGVPSGIASTTASFWSYAVMHGKDEFDLYIINTKKLRKLIADGIYYDKIFGGDIGSGTKMYRIKLEALAPHCKKL